MLRDANLVRVEKRAQQRIYYINPEPMKELEKWVHQLASQMEEQYSKLDKVLEIEKQRLNSKTNKEKDNVK